MGQIDLEQAHALLPESLLPATGVLQFFAGFPEPENEFGAAYDFYPEREAYHVFHHPSKQGLKQATYPADLPEVYRFRPTHHNLVLEYTLPDDESWVWRDQPISREDQDALDEVNFNGNAGPHVLGWPHGIQGDPAFDWATQDLELAYPLDEERIQKAKQASAAYVSLFQFDMPYTNRFEVIGESKVFFGIHRDALAQRDFDRAVLILQGT